MLDFLTHDAVPCVAWLLGLVAGVWLASSLVCWAFFLACLHSHAKE